MIIQADCREYLSTIPPSSIDAVVTDPPYFLDKLDDTWTHKQVSNTRNMKVVTSLPAGMKFDREQGRKFYKWYHEVSAALFRVLKPGGYFWSFSSPRLYHRMTCAMEDAGFDIRDQFIWMYTTNQPKAMSLNHFIDRLDIAETEKQSLKQHLAGWKTPQVKSCHEPIAMGQKPLDGTFLENEIKHGVGLVNTNLTIGQDMFVANVASTDDFDENIDKYFLVAKPSKKEKGDFNVHKTVKPVALCKYLIGLCTREDDVVLDPFCGSGSVCVAAKEMGRKWVGVDINSEYAEIARRRLTPS